MGEWNGSDPARDLPQRNTLNFHIRLSDAMEARIAAKEVTRQQVLENTFGFMFACTTYDDITFVCTLPWGGFDASVELQKERTAAQAKHPEYIDGDALYYPLSTDHSEYETLQSYALLNGHSDAYIQFLQAGGNPNLQDSTKEVGIANLVWRNKSEFCKDKSLINALLEHGFNILSHIKSERIGPAWIGDVNFAQLMDRHGTDLLKEAMHDCITLGNTVLEMIKNGESIEGCNAEEILQCINIGLLEEVMQPRLWPDHPERALEIIDQMPLWVQQELEPIWQATRERVEASQAPTEPDWCAVQARGSEHISPTPTVLQKGD